MSVGLRGRTLPCQVISFGRLQLEIELTYQDMIGLLR